MFEGRARAPFYFFINLDVIRDWKYISIDAGNWILGFIEKKIILLGKSMLIESIRWLIHGTSKT